MSIGETAVYRSLFCGYFNAKVTAVRFGAELIDIYVFSDGGKQLLHQTRVPLRADLASCQPGEAYIGERPKQ